MTAAVAAFQRAQRLLERPTRVMIAWYALVVALLGLVMAVTAVGLVRYAQWTKLDFHPGPSTYRGAAIIGALLAWAAIAASTRLAQARVRRSQADLPRLLGGIEVHATATHPAARRLVHVVEEMALAAQRPCPRIFVLGHEPGINACAFSWGADPGAIVVTLGCLYRLDRAELQAFVAHGVTELVHGDPRRRLRIIGLINGLQGVSALGLQLMRPQHGRTGLVLTDKLLLPLYPLSAVLGVVLMVAGGIAFLLGKALMAAAVRKRIRLGDAACSAFTRNPAALASALRQVGGFVLGSRLLGEDSRPFQALFLLHTQVPAWKLLDTHPPLAGRIRALDPQWDGAYPASHVVVGIAKQVQTV